MIRILLILFVLFLFTGIQAQTLVNSPSINTQDTLKSFLVRSNSNYLYSIRLNHREAGVGNKMLRGTLYVAAYNISMGAYLLAAPEYVSKWNKKEKFKVSSILTQYKKSFTLPPVIDHDLWFVNYIGHPYQGGYYYNSIRSQGATTTQSALFCIGQSLLWEYGWEAGMEQPSIQDMISTPLAGILVGELSHYATVKMSENGFRWYETILVCIINPAYIINNGVKAVRKH
jgi:hypothetical protein